MLLVHLSPPTVLWPLLINNEVRGLKVYFLGDSSISGLLRHDLSTSNFQSEVGEVFGEIGGELPVKFGRRFSSFFCWGKSSEALSTKTPPQISASNFTARFWVVAGPDDFLGLLGIAKENRPSSS